MRALDTLTPGDRFRVPYFGTGTLLRVGPTFAIVLPDRAPDEVDITTPAGTIHFRRPARPVTIAPGTEVEPLTKGTQP